MFDHVCLFLDLIESQEYWWGLDRIRISTVCRRMHCIQMLSCIVQIHLFNDIVNVFHWRWLQQTLGNADLWLNSLKSTIIGKVLARVLSCSSIFSESEVVLLRLSKHGHLAQVPVSVPHHAAENTAESQHRSINHFNSVKIQSREGKIAYKLETPKFSGGKNMTKKTKSWWMFQGSRARQRFWQRSNSQSYQSWSPPRFGDPKSESFGSQNDSNDPCKLQDM